MLVIRAGIHKLLVRIANKEGPNPKQSDLGLCCLSRQSSGTEVHLYLEF